MWFLPLFSETTGGSDLNIYCTLGTATADGFLAQVDRQVVILGSLGTATANGFIATVDQQLTINTSLGTATANGFLATVDRQLAILGVLGTATANGFLATIDFPSGGTYAKNGSYYLEVDSGLSIMLGGPRLPSWDTSGRPSSPKTFEIGFNTSTSKIEVWNGSTWVGVGLA